MTVNESQLYRTGIRDRFREFRNRVYDLPERTKLAISLGLDALGNTSYIFPPLEAIDPIYGLASAAWIYLAYDDPRWALAALLEESGPGTDIVPSCYLAHRAWVERMREEIQTEEEN